MFRKHLWAGKSNCCQVCYDPLPGYFQWHYFPNHPNLMWIIILVYKPKYWKNKQDSLMWFIASETKSNVLPFPKSCHRLGLSLGHRATVFHFPVTVSQVASFKHVSHNSFPVFSQHSNYCCVIILALPLSPALWEWYYVLFLIRAFTTLNVVLFI